MEEARGTGAGEQRVLDFCVAPPSRRQSLGRLARCRGQDALGTAGRCRRYGL